MQYLTNARYILFGIIQCSDNFHRTIFEIKNEKSFRSNWHVGTNSIYLSHNSHNKLTNDPMLKLLFFFFAQFVVTPTCV